MICRYVESLEALLHHINSTYGIRVTIHDVSGFSIINEELGQLIHKNFLHSSSLCEYAKSNPLTRKMCILNKYFANKKAARQGGSFCGLCYLCITEYVIPIIYESKFLGSIFVGQFTDDKRESLNSVRKKAVKYKLDVERTADLYNQNVLEVSNEMISNIISLCTSLRDYIILAYSYELQRKCAVYNGKDKMLDVLVDKSFSENYIVERAVEYIKNHFSMDISLKEVARYCFCSSYYLSRVFNRVRKESLTTFLSAVRVKASMKLLQDTDKSITSIAFEVGFNSQTYFSSIFHKLTGMSPAEYKEKNSAFTEQGKSKQESTYVFWGHFS